jgi:hypothetical protein
MTVDACGCFNTFVCLYCFIHFYSIVTISTSYEFVFCMDLWKMINKLKLKWLWTFPYKLGRYRRMEVLWNLPFPVGGEMWSEASHSQLDVVFLPVSLHHHHLKDTFKKNGYRSRDIQLALNSKTKPKIDPEKPVGVALLPYHHSTSNKISRLLAQHKIKTVHIPAKKTTNMLRPVKDNVGLKTCGVYCIPCECGQVYVGQTSRTTEISRQEHEAPTALSTRKVCCSRTNN